MTDFTHSIAILIGIDAWGRDIARLTAAVNDAAWVAEKIHIAWSWIYPPSPFFTEILV